jgi:hypothetical protein
MLVKEGLSTMLEQAYGMLTVLVSELVQLVRVWLQTFLVPV